MNTDQQSAEVEALIADFTDLVRTDTLIGRADRFLHDADGVVASLHEMGYVPVPRDPFKGRAPEPTADPSLYYTMFWRMFDKTPASMVQSSFRYRAQGLLAARLTLWADAERDLKRSVELAPTNARSPAIAASLSPWPASAR